MHYLLSYAIHVHAHVQIISALQMQLATKINIKIVYKTLQSLLDE